MFRHDGASSSELWRVVGEETASTWCVDAVLEEPVEPAGFTRVGAWGDSDGRPAYEGFGALGLVRGFEGWSGRRWGGA
jgi:hypothetical protein